MAPDVSEKAGAEVRDPDPFLAAGLFSGHDVRMPKITDDYRAKIRMWAANPQVIPPLPLPKLPKFSRQKFNSYEEMNEWKRQLLLRVAAETSNRG